MRLFNKDDLERIDPVKTVHLCVDVQNDYFNPEKGGRKTSTRKAGRIQELTEALDEYGIKTIWVYHTQVENKFYVVQPRSGDMILPKFYFSAFPNTLLDNTLQEQGMENIILTGGFTDCCISETARDALIKKL